MPETTHRATTQEIDTSSTPHGQRLAVHVDTRELVPVVRLGTATNPADARAVAEAPHGFRAARAIELPPSGVAHLLAALREADPDRGATDEQADAEPRPGYYAAVKQLNDGTATGALHAAACEYVARQGAEQLAHEPAVEEPETPDEVEHLEDPLTPEQDARASCLHQATVVVERLITAGRTRPGRHPMEMPLADVATGELIALARYVETGATESKDADR